MTVMTTWPRDIWGPGHVEAGHLGHVVAVTMGAATCLARCLGHVLAAPAHLLVGHVFARSCSPSHLRVSVSLMLVTVVALQGVRVLIRGCLSYPCKKF